MFHRKDQTRNQYMLNGTFARKGYDWWWHSFTAVNRKTKKETPFFVEFFIINPKLGGRAPIFGQLPESKREGKRPSYLMVKAGCWGEEKKQLHRFFGIDEVGIKKGAPYEITAGDCYASDERLVGSIHITEEERESHPEWMSDAGTISWDLKLEKEIAYNVGYGASKLFRDIKAFEMYWHVEGMKTRYAGTVTMNEEVYDVFPVSSFGYADKNWGRGFTSPWVWLSSNSLVSNLNGKKLTNTVFDIGGGRPKIYFLPLERKLLGGMYYEGEEFEYNFSKFWQMPTTRFSFWEDDTYVYWKVWQENRTSVMKVDVRCKKKDMLFINYEDPEGRKRHNHLWNGGNGEGRIRLYWKVQNGLKLIDDMKATHIGCEYGEYDEQ